MSLKREMHQRIEKELALWNNYELQRAHTGKGHNKIIITGPKGRSTVTYPSSPSDLRGIWNLRNRLRKTMAAIGADLIEA